MTSKHTPGPWVVHQRPREPYEHGHHVTTEDGLTICSVTYQLPSRTPMGVEETKRIANARLIAAAPELLEALETLECLWAESEVHGVDFSHAIEQARVALRRVKGEIE